jgi:hypothetical protein
MVPSIISHELFACKDTVIEIEVRYEYEQTVWFRKDSN